MSILPRAIAVLSILVVASSPLVLAQETKPTSPLIMDPNKTAATPPARAQGPLPPLAYKTPLPKTRVASIDGKDVTQADLLQYLIKGNWQTVTQTLILANLLDMELKKLGLTVTNEEISAEQEKILQKIAPGKTSAQVKEMGVFSEAEVRRQAWLSRGWDMVFIKENKMKPEQTADQANVILKQLFIRQKMEKYEIRQRGQDPGPPPGMIAQIKEKEGTEVRNVTADQALDFLMGLVKPGSLREATDDVVDSELVNRALAKVGKAVTEEEVEAWAWSMQEKYKPPFDWRMICQFKQTTPDQEKERWRRIQAWKRVTNFELNQDELKKFITENEEHFSGKHKSVSHILIKTRDPITDLPPTPEQEAEAKKKADDLREKIEQGLDFAWLAEHYSDDTTTAKAKGVLNTPIKKLATGLDPEFAAAAWKLELNDVSAPIKSKFGWHIIKCDKVTAGTRGGKDFEEPSYREWIIDEYETVMMRAWMKDARAKAQIDVVPNKELFKLKELKFTEDAPGGNGK
jgi:PPIC-type PPIASE domain